VSLVIPDQPPELHEPPERRFNHPAVRQHFESLGRVRALDDFDVHHFADAFNMIGEVFTAESTVDPQLPQPPVMAERLIEHALGSLTFGLVRGSNQD